MIRRILLKKNVDKILDLLDKEGELFFGQILRKTGINPSNLTILLTDLQLEGLIAKEEKSDYEGGRVKSYYKITDKGRQARYILKIMDMIDSLKEGQKLKCLIVDDNTETPIVV